MGSLPPVANAALAFGAGVALTRFGALWSIAPLIGSVLVFLPIHLSRRPSQSWVWLPLLLAGLFAGSRVSGEPECVTDRSVLVGRFLADPVGGSAPFRVEASKCEVRVVLGQQSAPAGHRVVLDGAWQEGRFRPWFRAARVGLAEDPSSFRWAYVRWAGVRWRASLVDRLRRQYGDRAPLVSALILARREGLDPDVRDAFARVGIAHLLAISGFHVGVFGGIVMAILRLGRLSRRRASVLSAVVTWGYVAVLGFPDAACRAALIMASVAVSKGQGRPPARWGALGSAFLILIVLDPTRLWSPGFQLSFAGAGGLVAWSPLLTKALRDATAGKMPRPVATALAAGAAATLATLPIVSWHFERISVVGIPVTLLASPIVSLAVPGALVGLFLDMVFEPAGDFIAGGVDLLLAVLATGAEGIARLSWASTWVSRSTVNALAVGAALGQLAARHSGLRLGARRLRVVAYMAAIGLLWPVLLSWTGRGQVQLVFIDVGQGDAVAIRTPRARWLLIDAGPPQRGNGQHPVVKELQAHGVQKLEALVLTHPDLDHFGGALDVIGSFPVAEIVDPARPSPKAGFIDILEASRDRGIRWRRAAAGQSWSIDGITLEVLAPADSLIQADTEANASSVVLWLKWGDFDAILTGDAPAEVERSISSRFSGRVEVLKVGHHGSTTSSDSLFLDRTRPKVAVVSAGRNNRFGHPAPAVLDRLERVGALVSRTDLDGTIRVIGRRDGSYSIIGARD